jgi:hypothetical protein
MAVSKKSFGEIRIKLDGENVKNHSVDVEELGNFLINFQGLIGKFSKTIPTKKKWQLNEIKSKSRLYLKAIGKGSVDLVLTGSPQMPLDESNHLQDAYNEVVSTSALINNNPSRARQFLNNKFTESKRRLEVEQKLKNMFTDKLQIGLLKDNESFVFLNSNREKEIDGWLKKDYNASTDTIMGIIQRLKGDGDKRYFTVRTYDKKLAKCYYNPELEIILKDYFKRQPVVIKGIVDHKVKGITIEKIVDLHAWKTIKLDKLGTYKFKKPFEFTLDFEDDLWFIESEELGIRGCSKNYDNALKDLQDSLKEAIHIYVKKGNPVNMTDKAKELREKLIKLVG